MKKPKKLFKIITLIFLIFVICFILAGTCKRKVSAYEIQPKDETISIYNNWNSPRVLAGFWLPFSYKAITETDFIRNDNDLIIAKVLIGENSFTINSLSATGDVWQNVSVNYIDNLEEYYTGSGVQTIDNLLLLVSVSNNGDIIYNLITLQLNRFYEIYARAEIISGRLAMGQGSASSAKIRTRTDDFLSVSNMIIFDAGFSNTINNTSYFVDYINDNISVLSIVDFAKNTYGAQYYRDGYADGHIDGLDEGEIIGYDNGYEDGYDVGYDDGQLGENAISPVLNILSAIFTGVGAIFSIELVPHVPLGVFILVPLFFAVVGLVLWIWRRN